MTKVAPSLLSADFCNMEQGVRMMECAGADYLHCDVMDGVFVPNISFGFQMISRLHDISDLPLDVHLMIVQPERYIERFAQAGADFITVHAEATDHLQRVLKQITQCGKKPGVVLNPATPLSYCKHYLNRIDVLTLMTVDVGFAGQPFITEILDKIAEAKRLREENGWHYKIMIDGSCNKKTFKRLYEAGADVFILGSSGLFSLDVDLQTACDKMKAQFEEETGVKP